MTAAEYQATLTRLGLSGAQAARLIGVCTRTEIRWATGRVAVPKPVSKLLTIIHRFGLIDAMKEELET